MQFLPLLFKCFNSSTPASFLVHNAHFSRSIQSWWIKSSPGLHFFFLNKLLLSEIQYVTEMKWHKTTLKYFSKECVGFGNGTSIQKLGSVKSINIQRKKERDLSLRFMSLNCIYNYLFEYKVLKINRYT